MDCLAELIGGFAKGVFVVVVAKIGDTDVVWSSDEGFIEFYQNVYGILREVKMIWGCLEGITVLKRFQSLLCEPSGFRRNVFLEVRFLRKRNRLR